MTGLEGVARAICVATGLDPDRKFKSSNESQETAPHEYAWHEFLPEARAAMNASSALLRAAFEAGREQADDENEANYRGGSLRKTSDEAFDAFLKDSGIQV